MPQPQLSASPSETTTETPTLPSRRPLRLDELTPEIAHLICEVIRLDGLADHLAGALVGVNRATLTRWKAEDDGFAMALERARGQFELGLIRTIREARKRDGSPDWRAQAWVLKHYSAEGCAKPARAAQPATATVQKRANLPETPGRPGEPLAGRIAPAAQKPSFVPETTQPAGAGRQRAA